MPTSTAFGKDRALFEEHQVRVVLAEGVLGLEVQRGLVAGLLADERLLDLGEQIVAAEEELDRFVQLVDLDALRVGESPGQADDAGGFDPHRIIIAQ